MKLVLIAAALSVIIAGPAFAQRSVGRGGTGAVGNGQVLRADRDRAETLRMEREAREARIAAEMTERRKAVDAQIAAGQAEVKAINDKAAAEMRSLTPDETARVAEIETRIANALKTRETAMAVNAEAKEKVQEELKDRARDRQDDLDNRRRAAGVASRGVRMNGRGAR